MSSPSLPVSQRSHLSRKSRRHARGYTAIEVLMAMTVFAVGAASVIAMERASLQGNADARKLDTANSIARDWVERLRRDATLWTQPGDLSKTNYLKQTGTYYGAWAVPDALCPAGTAGSNADGLCASFDIFGRDVAQDHYKDAGMYCANIRLDNASVDGGQADLIRADVRVFWPRQLTQSAAPFSGAKGFCDTAALASSSGPDGAPPTGGTGAYHFVHATTMIRMNAL